MLILNQIIWKFGIKRCLELLREQVMYFEPVLVLSGDLIIEMLKLSLKSWKYEKNKLFNMIIRASIIRWNYPCTQRGFNWWDADIESENLKIVNNKRLIMIEKTSNVRWTRPCAQRGLDYWDVEIEFKRLKTMKNERLIMIGRTSKKRWNFPCAQRGLDKRDEKKIEMLKIKNNKEYILVI